MSFTALPPRSAPVLNPANSQSFTVNWFGLFKAMQALFASGYTGTIVTAKLTGGGANGSIAFKNGVIVSQTAAT
jgi:hypothetical protein